MKTGLAIIATALLIGGAIIFTGSPSSTNTQPDGKNVSIVDGKQIVTISAKGGYTPHVSEAKADIPTIFRVETAGTFDCSSSVVIPSLSYRANLKPTGVLDIEIPPQKKNTTLQGLCAMGMYSFSVNFN
jgi:Cu+-exporting ATPase